MADVFISYKKEDRALVERVAAALTVAGYSVWWDYAITSQETWDRHIEQALDAAAAVLVLWTPASVESDFVRAEAREGKRQNKLVPALCAPCRVPVEFSGVQSADLIGWNGASDHPEWRRTLDWIARIAAGEAPPAMAAHVQAPTAVFVTETQFSGPRTPPPRAGESWGVAAFNTGRDSLGDLMASIKVEPWRIFQLFSKSPPRSVKEAQWADSEVIILTSSDYDFYDVKSGKRRPYRSEWISHRVALCRTPRNFTYDSKTTVDTLFDRGIAIRERELDQEFRLIAGCRRRPDSPILLADRRRIVLIAKNQEYWNTGKSLLPYVFFDLKLDGDVEEKRLWGMGVFPFFWSDKGKRYNEPNVIPDSFLPLSLNFSPSGNEVTLSCYDFINSGHFYKSGNKKMFFWRVPRGAGGITPKPNITAEVALSDEQPEAPSWSPSGSYVVLSNRFHSTPELLVLSAQRDKLKSIPADGDWRFMGPPSWHPVKDIFAVIGIYVVEDDHGDVLHEEWRVEIIDAATGQRVKVRHSEHAKTTGIPCWSWSPDGRYLVTGSGDQSVIIWDLLTDTTRTLYGDAGHPSRLDFSPDGQRLAIQDFGKKGEISLWDHATGTQLARWPGSITLFNDSCWHHESRMIASVKDPHTVEIRRLEM